MADMTTLTWRTARTLTDLAELTADWLARDLDAHPGWGSGSDRAPDSETFEIADHLIALNRAGWLTIDSQPGYDRDQNGYTQRHGVKFILSQAQAEQLEAACIGRFPCSWPTPLAGAPGPAGLWDLLANPVMVSRVEAGDGAIEGACWFGCGPEEEWGLLFGDGPDDLTPELRAVLEEDATIVAVAAPTWGTDDSGLWAWLRDRAAATRS
jgi:hypothetical protein